VVVVVVVVVCGWVGAVFGLIPDRIWRKRLDSG
jgi:hypothetical protein